MPFAQVAAVPGFDQPVSSFTHLVAAALFLVLTLVLVRRGRESAPVAIGLLVFGLSTVFLLSMSGVYHSLSPSAGRSVLRVLDYTGVFVLVAGTFTPVHMILFRGAGRWLPLVLIWSAAIAGITIRALFADSVPPAVVTGCFLALGWAGVSSGVILWRRAGFACIRPLLMGGLAYTAGAAVLAADWMRPLPGVIETHEVWHLAVLVGISLHWSFMFRLAPQPAPHYLPAIRRREPVLAALA